MLKAKGLLAGLGLLILLSGTTLTNSASQQVEFPSTSGNAFVRVCSGIEKHDATHTEIQHAIACLAYVEGITHGVAAESAWVRVAANKEPPRPFCLPENVENGQLVGIALKYIRNHPEKSHQSGALLVVESLSEALPCSNK